MSIRITISEGNRKMGFVPSISLPPIISCAEDVPCKKACYVIKNMAFRPLILRSYEKNWSALLKDRSQYFDAIKDRAVRNLIFFRYHVGGDIPDQDYYDRMVSLAKEVSNVKFLAMTKSYMTSSYRRWRLAGYPSDGPDFTDEDIDYSKPPNNLSILISAWPGYPIPERLKDFPVAYMQDGTEDRIPKRAFLCPHGCDICHACWDAKKRRIDIILPKH